MSSFIETSVWENSEEEDNAYFEVGFGYHSKYKRCSKFNDVIKELENERKQVADKVDLFQIQTPLLVETSVNTKNRSSFLKSMSKIGSQKKFGEKILTDASRFKFPFIEKQSTSDFNLPTLESERNFIFDQERKKSQENQAHQFTKHIQENHQNVQQNETELFSEKISMGITSEQHSEVHYELKNQASPEFSQDLSSKELKTLISREFDENILFK